MKGGEHGALGGRDEPGKGGWNLGLCSALKLPMSLPGPQLCGAKGGPHRGDRDGDEHGEGVPSGRPPGKATKGPQGLCLRRCSQVSRAPCRSLWEPRDKPT